MDEEKVAKILTEEARKFSNDSMVAMQRLTNKIMKEIHIRCQCLDCKRPGLIKVREGIHWYWACSVHAEGRIPLNSK